LASWREIFLFRLLLRCDDVVCGEEKKEENSLAKTPRSEKKNP
jgi:hypothetical protein